MSSGRSVLFGRCGKIGVQWQEAIVKQALELRAWFFCRVVHDDVNVWGAERSFGAVAIFSRVAKDCLNESGLGMP